VERWSFANIFGLEIGSLELDLPKPIFSACPHACILAICTGEFGNDFLQFETSDVQELDDMMLLQLDQSDTFQLFTVCIAEMPACFSRAKPKLSQHISISCGY
jgi:hypothetical protein